MKTYDMTKGHPVRLIVAFAIPLMLGNVFQQLYTTVDTIIVGQTLGVTALAALGACEMLNWLVLSLMQGMTQGFSIHAAQAYGAGDEKEFKKTVGNSTVVSILLGFVIMIAALLLLRPMLGLMHTPDDIVETAVTYSRVIFVGVPIITIYNLCAALLRAIGDSRTPLLAMVAASILNIALDLLFIVVFGMGVAGAAVATVMAQLFASCFCLFFLLKHKIMHLEKTDFVPYGNMCGELLRLGSPMAFQNVVIAIGGLVIQSVVNNYGVLFIAGYTATNKLYGLLEIAATSFGFALTTYAAQNYGARNYDRIRAGVRYGSYVSLAVSAVIAAIMLGFGRWILGLFISGSPEEIRETLTIAYRYLAVMSTMLPILYMLYVMRSTIQGLGDTMRPMLSGMAELTMRIGSVLILPAFIGEYGIFVAEVFAWAGADVVLFLSLRMHLKQLKNA